MSECTNELSLKDIDNRYENKFVLINPEVVKPIFISDGISDFFLNKDTPYCRTNTKCHLKSHNDCGGPHYHGEDIVMEEHYPFKV